jgi:hypothetical protein
MILSPSDAQLFFKLMWGVQYFFNQQTEVLKGITSEEKYAHLPSEKKLKVRDQLWKRPELMDDYIQANPDAFSNDELEIIRRWRSQFLKGTFLRIPTFEKRDHIYW